MVAHQAGMARTQGTGPADSKPARGVFEDAASRRTGGTRPPTGELHSRSRHCTPKPLRPPGLGETSLEWPPKALRQPRSRQRSPDPRKTMPAQGAPGRPFNCSDSSQRSLQPPDPISRPDFSTLAIATDNAFIDGYPGEHHLLIRAGIGSDLLRSGSAAPFATCPSFSCSAPREEPPC